MSNLGRPDAIILGEGGTAIATNTVIEQGNIVIVDGGVGTVAGGAGGNTAQVFEGGSLVAMSGGVATVNYGGLARVGPCSASE